MKTRKFSKAHFLRFCESMTIDSKEDGLVPLRLNGAQRYFVDRMIDGLNNGIRRFTILKARQLGISTISLALDLYWNFMHPGLQGTLVTDTETNRENFRSILTGYMNSLPKQWRVPVRQHNRTLLVLGNRSRFIYQVAGTRAKGSLGRGTAVGFAHMTECSSWGDEEGMVSLLATFAESNPNRLYIAESTAQGYNMFYNLWKEAKQSVTQEAIFIGWWRNERYSFPKDSQLYNVYWDGSLNSEEQKWVREVKQLYDFDITPEQIAWWRWKSDELVGEGSMIMQEYPACVTAETRIGTEKGIIRIDSAKPGMPATLGIVTDTHANKPSVIWKATTESGYSVRGTADHPLFRPDGTLIDLSKSLGETVALCPPMTATDIHIISWKEGPVHSIVPVEENIARFVGIFMGDGSFSIKGSSSDPDGGTGTLSIAFDAQDTDYIQDTGNLVRNLFGVNTYTRKNSNNGIELRATSSSLVKVFRSMGIIRNDTGKTMRKVHVPEFIWRSPKRVIREFLSGLFEADGFADRSGNRIVLFSKYPEFIQDIRILLLAFGITSKFRSSIKKATRDGKTHAYHGNELILRKNEVSLFAREIGFLSERKKSRSISKKTGKSGTRALPVLMQDRVVSVVEDGYEPVYNLTVEGENAFDANGIKTHNTEDHAFILTGSQFFTGEKLTQSVREIKTADKEPDYFRYRFGDEFDQTELAASSSENAELTIWEYPRQGGIYVLGCDPAYGSSDWADRFAITVFRCFSDRIVQVAEYCTDRASTYSFAWVILHLAGAYPNSHYNLEINGPGQAVWNEIQNIKRKASMLPDGHSQSIYNVAASMREYLYKRVDSLTGGGYSRHSVTTANTKERMMNIFRDYFERGMCIVRSGECLEEMRSIVRNEGSIRASGRGKDDRVIAAALAAIMWHDQIVMPLAMRNETYSSAMNREHSEDRGRPNDNAASQTVRDYLRRIGMT